MNIEQVEIKKQLGQFYTTNYDYILNGLYIPSHIEKIIEPFVGNGDLLKFINKTEKKYKIEKYDIEPKIDGAIQQDTLLHSPDYNNKFIITNPPYLARNKSIDKTIFDKYNQNDLYKCFISILTSNLCLGGIIIIPLNFWCSIRKSDIELRKSFLNKYNICRINIFEEKVFDDTSYTICSFQFCLKCSSTSNITDNISSMSNINTHIYPSKKEINILLNENTDYTIGGEIYKLPLSKTIKITRLTSSNKNMENKANIIIKCIDDNINSKICLKMVDDNNIYIDTTPKLSARSYASIIITPYIDKDKQKELVIKFNKYIEEQRTKYNSLFLTNYRESNSIARKRISFKLVFNIINYLLSSSLK